MPSRHFGCSKHLCFLRCFVMNLLISVALAPPVFEPSALHAPSPVSPNGWNTVTTAATLLLVVLFVITMLQGRASRASAIIKRVRCVHCNATFTGIKTFRVHHNSCTAAPRSCASLAGKACDGCCTLCGTANVEIAEKRNIEGMRRITADVIAAATEDATLPNLMERL
jgi:hypothetical protein